MSRHRHQAAREASSTWSVRCVRAVLIGILLSAPAVQSHAQTIKLAGAGAALGAMTQLGEAYRRTDRTLSLVVVPNLGSGGGLKALMAGAIDLAVITRPLTDEEHATGLSAFEYGRTPFVLATSGHAKLDITLEQATATVSGKVSQWPDGSPIRIVLRPRRDGDTALLASFSPAMKEALEGAHARPGMMIATSDQDSASEIERRSGSFGTSSLALILSEHRNMHPLSINGVAPTVKELAAGRYPYALILYLVKRSDASPAARRFAQFVRSAKGSAILVQTGHWIVDEPAGAARASR